MTAAARSVGDASDVLLPVQADRKEAADWYGSQPGYGVDLPLQIMAELRDNDPLVQAFARHRIAQPQSGDVGAEPFGYWVEQRLAEPLLLRKPAYIPEPNERRTVTPLYAAVAARLPKASMTWAIALTNHWQGQRDTPRSEAPGQYEVERAHRAITDVLAVLPNPDRPPQTPTTDAARRADEGACAVSPDHADILETIANADDDWQKKGYTSALAEVRDMANVGRALMEALPEGYGYSDCPSEIVADLQNEIADSTDAARRAALEEAAKVVEGFFSPNASAENLYAAQVAAEIRALAAGDAA